MRGGLGKQLSPTWTNDFILVYKSTPDRWEMEAKPSGAGVPSDTVVSETTFGQSPAAGVATAYSRGDHTHGSPSDPIPAHNVATGIHGVGAQYLAKTPRTDQLIDHADLVNVLADQHHARSHDHSLAADGSPIAVAGVPNLPASKITSGRFGMPRMPDGTLNYVLKAGGVGVDPAYGQVAHTELTGVAADQHHAQLHKDSHKSGGGDAFALTDLLDCLARLEVKKAGVSVGKRRGLNLIEGANVTLTVADDPTNEKVDVTIAAAGGAGGVSLPEDITFLAVGANVAWTNQPAALTEFLGATRNRTKYDLTNATQVRLIVNVMVAGATTPAKIRAQYSTDLSTWYYLDGASGPSVDINTTGLKVSAWVNLAAGAKADVYLRIVGIDGNGAADPAFGNIALQVK